MLAVYETIDLGLVSILDRTPGSSDPSVLDLLQANHPVFHTDPIHDDTVYVYHAFGVHALYLGPMLRALGAALRAEDDEEGTELTSALNQCAATNVQAILTTFSVERKYAVFSVFSLRSELTNISQMLKSNHRCCCSKRCLPYI